MNEMRKRLVKKGSQSTAQLSGYCKKSTSSSCGRSKEPIQQISEGLKYTKGGKMKKSEEEIKYNKQSYPSKYPHDRIFKT